MNPTENTESVELESAPLEAQDSSAETPQEPTPNPLLDFFLSIYPEFNALTNKQVIINMFKKISLLYPSYKPTEPLDTERAEIYPFAMLVAHYLVIGGYAIEIGLGKPSGLVASSSIDGVSVSYQAQITKDQFQYFFSQTPYGQEYLAYLNTQAGLRLINNANYRF